MILLSAHYVSKHGVQCLAMAPVGPILADIRSHSVSYPIRQGRNSTTTVQAALTLDGYGILGLPATHSSLSDPAGPTAGLHAGPRDTWAQSRLTAEGLPVPAPVQVGSPGSYTVIQGASRASRSRDWQRGTWVKPGSALLLSCSPVSLLYLPLLRQLVQAQVI